MSHAKGQIIHYNVEPIIQPVKSQMVNLYDLPNCFWIHKRTLQNNNRERSVKRQNLTNLTCFFSSKKWKRHSNPKGGYGALSAAFLWWPARNWAAITQSLVLFWSVCECGAGRSRSRGRFPAGSTPGWFSLPGVSRVTPSLTRGGSLAWRSLIQRTAVTCENKHSRAKRQRFRL